MVKVLADLISSEDCLLDLWTNDTKLLCNRMTEMVTDESKLCWVFSYEDTNHSD